ncbi:ATP-binding cassette sub-family A member 2-like [Ixodes scapularis]
MRSKSTLIISTHDMEEADILADRIIVMADGRALCGGSPAFLKKAYGVGYQLRIIKDPEGLDLSQVLRTVRKAAPKAEAEDKMKEAIVSLNTLSHAGFVRMFKELEERGTELGIQAIGVMVATLRDVYIKINLGWVPDGVNPRTDYMPDENDVSIAGSVSGARPGAARQLRALLTKRVIFFSQSYFLMLFIFLTPALVFLTEFRGNRETLLELSVNIRSLPLSMKALYGDAHTFGQHDVAAKDYFEQYRPLVESEDATLRIFENATKELLTEAQEDYVAFSQAYLLGGVFEGQRTPVYEKQGPKWCIASPGGPRRVQTYPGLGSTTRMPFSPDTGKPRTAIRGRANPHGSGSVETPLSKHLLSQVVILDEPSAGLDTENKREIWDLLLGMRSKSTLIISTHDMEEADVLADRIIVMADGRALCGGSPAFLKKAYGVGYQLRIIKDPKGLDLSQVLRTVRKAAPKAEADDKMKEAIVSLNTLSHAGFVRMFKELEERGTELGIQAIGVMVATLRDVYIK